MKFRELREKTLTPAEKKKREEIAKAIEKDNPDMPMDKKMAIATATAKRVAEGAKPEFEVKYAKSKRGPIKVTKFMDMASAKKFLDGKKKEGYNGIISKGGKPVKEEVEMVSEAVDFFKVAKAFDDYAKKYGGIDKKDFMKVGAFVRQLGKESDVNKQDRTFIQMKHYIDKMDTDPRDGVFQIFQKHGMIKNNRLVREYGGPKISRDEYIKKGKEYHAQKEGVDFFALREKKDSYPLYHKTYSDAMAAAYAYAKKKGYEVDPDDIDRKVATGPRKPSNGKTNSFTLKLKDEKRKMLAVQVTNLDNKRYELNTYIT